MGSWSDSRDAIRENRERIVSPVMPLKQRPEAASILEACQVIVIGLQSSKWEKKIHVSELSSPCAFLRRGQNDSTTETSLDGPNIYGMRNGCEMMIYPKVATYAYGTG